MNSHKVIGDFPDRWELIFCHWSFPSGSWSNGSKSRWPSETISPLGSFKPGIAGVNPEETRLAPLRSFIGMERQTYGETN